MSNAVDIAMNRKSTAMYAGRPHVLLERGWIAFRSTNWIPVVTGFVEPVLFLLAFGYGMGSLVGDVTTGNKTIDTQHKELIERIQNFVTACQNGDSKLKAIKMLDYLDEYTNFHFKEEEKLQENAGYPEYEKHHEKHEEFKKTIQELQEYLQDYEGPTEQFSELVQKNVIDWLFGHIKTYDRSVAEFIFMRENPDRY